MDNALAYKDMNACYYYSATIIMFAASAFGACVIPGVNIIFSFVATISITFISFLFPAGTYLLGKKYYLKREAEKGNQVKLEDSFLVWSSFF